MSFQPSPALPGDAASPLSPLDPAFLAQMASAIYGTLSMPPPGVRPAPPLGTQAPGNMAPPGSPLASPAGLGPGVPGPGAPDRPVPQGRIPGANLMPASPTQALTPLNRAPAMLPSAPAGNGVPDKLFSAVPAYEPRMGGALLGVAPPSFAPPSLAPQFYFLDELSAPGAPVAAARDEPYGRLPVADFDVHAVRRDFPTLAERINGHQLVWLDNAATTHKPQAVIDRIAQFYAHENSNIHRAAHTLAARATDAYEGARESVRRFINAPEVEEVIFVRGATEAINLVANSWGDKHIREDDEIVVSHLEHHANIVPWQQLAMRKGARLRVIPVDDSGQLLLDEFGKLLNERTKLVAITQVSNALGTATPVKEIAAMAHRAGACVLVDGAQGVSHKRTDVRDLDADFYVFSGHKVYGPTGIGVLWGKRAVLEDMPPWQGGGNMIADVSFEKTVYQGIPNKFEAGTGNIADAVGLAAALDYVTRLGMENIACYEQALLAYGMRELAGVPGVRMIGTAQDKASVMSFVLAGYSTAEVGTALNEQGIAVRTGHHCAQPILRRFGVETSVRPSLAFYNTFGEIDRMVAVVRQMAGRGRAL